MKRAAAMALIGLLGAACGAGDDLDDEEGDGKEDRPSAAADRGDLEIGTSRRARFTEAGQTHAYKLVVRAGSQVELWANPIASQEKTLKTTIKLFGPVGPSGALPAQPIASSEDGTFAIRQTLAAAGEYRLVVGTRTRKMTGSYDVFAYCANHACHPDPVALTDRKPQAALAHAADDIECGSGCFGEIHAYVYDDARSPSLAAVTEAVIKDLSQGDEDWNALRPLDGDELEKTFTDMKLDDLLLQARSFAGSTVVHGAVVHGLVQIPIDDFGTDGFDQDVYLLHYPDAHAVVALLVKD